MPPFPNIRNIVSSFPISASNRHQTPSHLPPSYSMLFDAGIQLDEINQLLHNPILTGRCFFTFHWPCPLYSVYYPYPYLT